jgi:biotin synthase
MNTLSTATITIGMEEIVGWLRETDPARLEDLWRWADEVRHRYVGGDVHLRGLVEFSNYCVRLCAYCGLRAPNGGITRYRMTADEILACVRQAVSFGYGTLVLQSGEDPGVTAEWMSDLVRRIKAQTPLAVTLSLGEREDEELWAWRRAGADRYLLRFETSNRALYDRVHPPRPGTRSDRIAMLGRVRAMGYEIGSGVMIGIPGQSHEDLARDIEVFAGLELDMIGVGPYLVHPDTPLGEPGIRPLPPDDCQVPADELTTYKVIALARLVCPRANIPSTTALATLNRQNGRELGLVRGANVVMPNLTPPQYRVHYEIYPNKACIRETAGACHQCLEARIAAIGRSVGSGPGTSPAYRLRAACGEASGGDGGQ